MKKALKQLAVFVLTIGLFFTVLQLDYDIKQYKKYKKQEELLLANNNYYYDTLQGIYPDKEELVEYIKSYGITVEFDLSYAEINEKYSIFEGTGDLDTEYPITKTEGDEELNQIQVLVALKETLDNYTDEAIAKLPSVIVINKQPVDNETSGLTFTDQYNSYLMVLYYYPTVDYYFVNLTTYKETINHEILHCLDEYKYEEDTEWQAIDEDCSNISEYACSDIREERASVWGYWLGYDITPNTQKLKLLQERYSKYLKNS